MKKNLFKIFLLLLSIVFATDIYALTQKAIIIGIDQYAKIPKLQYSVSDAQKLSQLLTKNGFDCQTITNAGATKENIIDAFIQLEQLMNQGTEIDILFVYFSCRGARVPDDIQADESKDNLDECILPSDAEVDIPRTYIRDDAIALWLSSIKAKQTFLILDCGFWGDGSDPNIKGLGKIPEGKTLDGFEMDDGLPSNLLLLYSGKPDAKVVDGVFMEKIFASAKLEEADKNGDRMISLIEAYQYALSQLQNQQAPLLYNSKNYDIFLAPLPRLSNLVINSEPEGAEIKIFSDTTQLYQNSNLKTPQTISLKTGTYTIKAQKSGFFIPKDQKIDILKYEETYSLEPIIFKPISILGKIKIDSKSGETLSSEGESFLLVVKQEGNEVYSKVIFTDETVRFGYGNDGWIKPDAEYEVFITGASVLSVTPARFVYAGNNDIGFNMTVVVDDVPPVLQQNGIDIKTLYLVVNDVLSGTIKAQDDGLGLVDSIGIKLGLSERKTTFDIPPDQVTFQPPSTYRFNHPLEEEQGGKWNISEITLRDKAGNENKISGDQIKISFTLFDDHYELGKHYFDTSDFATALDNFKREKSPDDDTKYYIALCYYQQSDIKKALETYDSITEKLNYIGYARERKMPKLPRTMANKIWGRMLDKLKDNKKNPDFIKLLASTAEELGREDEARRYRDYANKLRK